jgi:hypothetical protein
MSLPYKEYKPREQSIKAFEEVIKLIQSRGDSIKKACEKVKCSEKSFFNVLNSSNDYLQSYLRACEARGYLMAEQTINIYDDVPDTIDVGGRIEQNNIGLNKARAKAEALKWYASKLNPSLSDKPNTQVNIASNEASFTIEMGGKPINLQKDIKVIE